MRRDIAGHVGEVGEWRALGCKVRMVRSGMEERLKNHCRISVGRRERAKTCVDEFEVVLGG